MTVWLETIDHSLHLTSSYQPVQMFKLVLFQLQIMVCVLKAQLTFESIRGRVTIPVEIPRAFLRDVSHQDWRK